MVRRVPVLVEESSHSVDDGAGVVTHAERLLEIGLGPGRDFNEMHSFTITCTC